MIEARKLARLTPSLVVTAAAMALAVWVIALAPHGIFSGDSGVKIAQAHALLDSGFESRALVYDYDFDPEHRYFPYQKQDFTQVVNGKRQGTYSLFFTALAAVLVAVFGKLGLLVMPLAGGIASGVGGFALARRVGVSPLVAAGVAVIAMWVTPMFFYASQFWEHGVAAGLVTAGLWMMTPGDERRERPMLAGVLLAIAGTFRPECYCAVAAAGFAVVALPAASFKARAWRGALYLAGAIPVLVAFWGLNVWTAGTWDLAVSANANPASALGAFTMLVGKVRATHDLAAWTLIAAVVVALIPWRWRAGTLGLVPHAILTALVGWVAWQTQSESTARVLTGLFSVTPLLAYGVFAGPFFARSRHLWMFATLFLVQVLLLERGDNAGGLQLGARFLLPAVPALLVLAAAVAYREWTEGRFRGVRRATVVVSIAALLIISATGLNKGAHQALAIANQGESVTAVVEKLPADVVITFRGWESQVLAPALLDGKRFYLVRGNPRPLYERLVKRGVESFSVVTRNPVDIRLSDGRRLRTVAEYPGWLDIQHVELSPQ